MITTFFTFKHEVSFNWTPPDLPYGISFEKLTTESHHDWLDVET